jgi:hypothetical protein
VKTKAYKTEMDFRSKGTETQSQEDDDVCDSFNDVVRTSDCVVSNDMVA